MKLRNGLYGDYSEKQLFLFYKVGHFVHKHTHTHTHTMIAFASPTHMNEGDFDDQAGSRFYFPRDTG